MEGNKIVNVGKTSDGPRRHTIDAMESSSRRALTTVPIAIPRFD